MIVFPSDPEIGEAELPKPQDYTRFHPFIKGLFSQWHPTQFELDGERFSCAEQYMMAAKASLFGDLESGRAIMTSDDPAVQKRLGAQVGGFDEEIWQNWRVHIVYRANHAKFTQNRGAMRRLQNTSPDMLVEANPRDWNWGNGLQIDDAQNQNPTAWKGANLLGRILTLIREKTAPRPVA